MASKALFSSLTRRTHFLLLKEKGRRMRVTSWLMVNWAISTEAQLRLGMTLPKQVGAAVLRNKLKRWGRDYMRTQSRTLSVLPNWSGVDINLIFLSPRKGFLTTLSREEFNEALDKVIIKMAKQIGPTN